MMAKDANLTLPEVLNEGLAEKQEANHLEDQFVEKVLYTNLDQPNEDQPNPPLADKQLLNNISKDKDEFEKGAEIKRMVGKLKQLKSASNYATEFRIITNKLEWSDPALIASFHQELKAEVRSKPIEYTLHKNITELDEFISTACLIDHTLFEACKELRNDSNSSTSSPQRPAQGHSSTFVSKKVQEARRNAGECSKCGEKSHKWEDCKNGWHLKTIERSKPDSGKAAEVEELELLPQAGKEVLYTQTALIDSGSSANFVDPQFARSHNIPLIELDSPRSVIINGKQVCNPIRFKAQLVFSSQNRQLSTIFYALPHGNRNLILGTPWLKLANPDID
ncbi:Retrotransposable element Tf2 protein [Rhizoctonia solani]|uniref:Retrotransposable element Tf2 protein n=1 Tax=Rhizoctonia solani TaxID=456999 RepID=A0A8H8P1A0_9AGAM|nr:Retrotransposable element Tf2 protein [Rhizoctonia solani]QRW21857.1 Retrotransposable element Tf2 protein [Rhizoctonia solani]